MSETSALPKPEGRASVDYLRKLHQQLVQKDNIIKLLQLQVKNLEAADSESETVDQLSAALADADDKLTLMAEELETRTHEVTRLQEQLTDAEGRNADLSGKARDTARLEAAVSLKEEELARQRELLRSAEKQGDRLGQLEADLNENVAARTRLERELGRARERATRSSADADEVRDLRGQLADLEAALEVARRHVELSTPADLDPSQDRFPMLQNVIEALQVLEDTRAQLTAPEEALDALDEYMSDLRDQLGLERIQATGHAFDAEIHALGRVVYSEEGEHDSVIAEEVAGYRCGSRLIKQAQVTVVRNPYQCSECQSLGVQGASFCHVCGSRIVARDTSETPASRNLPRNEARKLLEVSRSLGRRGQQDAAREKLEMALSMAPEDPHVLYEVARLDEEEGRFDDAVGRLEGIPERVPGLKGLSELRDRLAYKKEILEKLKGLR